LNLSTGSGTLSASRNPVEELPNSSLLYTNLGYANVKSLHMV